MSSGIFNRDLICCAACGELRTAFDREHVADGLCEACAVIRHELRGLAQGFDPYGPCGAPPDVDYGAGEGRPRSSGAANDGVTTSPALVLPDDPSPLARIDRLAEDDALTGAWIGGVLLACIVALIAWGVWA